MITSHRAWRELVAATPALTNDSCSSSWFQPRRPLGHDGLCDLGEQLLLACGAETGVARSVEALLAFPLQDVSQQFPAGTSSGNDERRLRAYLDTWLTLAAARGMAVTANVLL
jgi:hypothetical protein